MGLPKAHRLRNRHHFNRLFQRGKRFASSHLKLVAIKGTDNPKISESKRGGEPIIVVPLPSCLGISVSQKVSKRAVVRNRIKRQLRAAFLSLMPLVAPGWHLVLVVKPSAVQCDYHQFLQELEQLLVKAKVLKNGHSGRCVL